MKHTVLSATKSIPLVAEGSRHVQLLVTARSIPLIAEGSIHVQLIVTALAFGNHLGIQLQRANLQDKIIVLSGKQYLTLEPWPRRGSSACTARSGSMAFTLNW